MIVSYIVYNYPHEKEFSSDTTLEQVHKYLDRKGHTYVIMGIRYKN